MKQINGSVIIITGASAGIGAATARSLAQRGARLVLTARRAERLETLATTLRASGCEVLVVAGDVQDPAFGKMLAGMTLEKFGRIDVLVNNAGIGHKHTLSDVPPDAITTVLTTNVNGVINMIQAVLPTMRQQGSGQIINVSSIVGQRPMTRSAVYTASKAAVNHITRALRMELRKTPLVITSVYPGTTETEFADAQLGGDGRKRKLPRVPASRVADKIENAIERQCTEVYITRLDWLFTHLNRLFPRLTDWVFARVFR